MSLKLDIIDSIGLRFEISGKPAVRGNVIQDGLEDTRAKRLLKCDSIKRESPA